MIQINIDKTLHGVQGTMNLHVDITVEDGVFIVIMGESGSGKTTLLRIIAGLEEALGKITVSDEVWLDSSFKLVPQKREIGFVFQDYALFEHMTVEQNLLFVRDDKTLAKELLQITALTGLATRHVKSLSGGQKQRVSLCRAMMNKPKLLLMDEPFSALDDKMKHNLQEKIKYLHQKFGTTTLMVSHDAQSAYALADRIIVLHEGKVLLDGHKNEVLKKERKIVYSVIEKHL